MKVKVWLSGQIIDASGNASNLWVIEADDKSFHKELVLDLSISLNDIISQIKSGQIPITQIPAQAQTEGEIDI